MKKRLLLPIALLALCAALIFMLHTASKAVVETDFTFPSRGVHVPATLTAPKYGSGHPVVLMAHGHNGTRNERFGFTVIARELARHGVASIRMDFAGCGESAEPFTACSLTSMKADVLSAAAYAEETLGSACVGLFGYSMGGRVVLELLAEGFPAGAAVLLAPAADTAGLMRFFGGDEHFAALHETARQAGSAPLTAHETVGLQWFEDLMCYEDPASGAAGAYSGPSLVLYGSDDTVVTPDICLSAAQALGSDTLDVGGKGHGYGFFREDDELLARIADETAQYFSAHLQ